MAQGFHWLDHVVFAATLVVALGIGIYYACAGGGQKSTNEYLMGGRNMKVLPVALSLLVSFVSAVGILGTPAEMYAYGTQYSMHIFAATLGCIYGAYLFVPLFYPLKLTSSYEYFELRYKSKPPRIVGSCIMIMMGVFNIATGLFAPSTALVAVTGFPVWLSMVICSAVGTIYTCLGGMKAVIWTDVFQSVVIFLGMIAVVVVGVVRVGGFGEVWRLNSEWDRIEFFNMDPDPRERSSFWSIVVVMSFLFMVMTTSQMSVQRYCSLPTLQAARRSVLLNIPGFVLIGVLGSLAGVVVFAYYAKQGCDPLSSGRLNNPNQILPYFVNDVMGYPGMSGLFVACLYSGTLSSISSSLNAMAAVTWEDGLKWKFHYLSPIAQTNITKVLVAGYGVIGLGVGFLVSRMGGTFIQITFSIMGTTLGPVMGMFFLGGLVPRAGANGAILGGIIGFCISAWMAIGNYMMAYYESPLPFPRDNCPVQNGTMGVKFPMTMLNETMGRNKTGGPPGAPRELEGLENLYAVSYLWYPLIGMVSVLLVGICTSCIPGLRQEGYVKKKYLFPCIRNASRWCQPRGVLPCEDSSDEEEADDNGRNLQTGDTPTWKSSQSPIFQFKKPPPTKDMVTANGNATDYELAESPTRDGDPRNYPTEEHMPLAHI